MRFHELKVVPMLLTVFSITTVLTACGGSGSSASQSDSHGSFSLAVTDAPVDSAVAVVVEFSGVSVKPADGTAIELLFDEPHSIDLLALQGNASQEIVTDTLLPAGDYEWIRLHVNAEQDNVMDSYVETDTGTQLELWVPSGSQTGLKLVRGFTVLAGGAVDFTVDFDLRKSIVSPPAVSGKSIMLKPVLRLVDNISAGGISGTVDSAIIAEACADPSTELGAVYVFSGADATPVDVSGTETDPLTTALVSYADDMYSYEIGFLPMGEYTLAYTCDAAIDDPETADDLNFIGAATVVVEEGSEASLDFVLGGTDQETESASAEE